MRTLREDNTGFVHFPNDDNYLSTFGKTLVYIVAYTNVNNYILSNVKMTIKSTQEDIEDDILLYDGEFFESNPLVTSICVGWCDGNYISKYENKFWTADFKDLTNEGRKLYYSIKKLHNNKEVKILTINSVS
jgi:hypothetical protein